MKFRVQNRDVNFASRLIQRNAATHTLSHCSLFATIRGPTQVQSAHHIQSSRAKLTCSSTAAWLSPMLPIHSTHDLSWCLLILLMSSIQNFYLFLIVRNKCGLPGYSPACSHSSASFSCSFCRCRIVIVTWIRDNDRILPRLERTVNARIVKRIRDNLRYQDFKGKHYRLLLHAVSPTSIHSYPSRLLAHPMSPCALGQGHVTMIDCMPCLYYCTVIEL